MKPAAATRHCLIALSLFVGSCSRAPEAAPVATHVRLPAGLVAKVGADEIALSTVTAIAQAQKLTPEAARELAARDAAFAAGAREVFAGGSIVPVVERGARARAILEGLKADAAALGPASDAEVAELSAQRWQDVDRPETVRTTHAVAIASKPAQEPLARAVAQRIYEAVRGLRDPEAFIRAAQAVPHEGVEVRAVAMLVEACDKGIDAVEGAPPELANQRFDKDFAEAAHRLAVGEIGEPAKSVFGYHVILCEARLPANHVPLEERRKLLASEVQKSRAERAKQELLARLSSGTAIAITRSVEDLTAQVQVTE